jgi:hypothetical protein
MALCHLTLLNFIYGCKPRLQEGAPLEGTYEGKKQAYHKRRAARRL